MNIAHVGLLGCGSVRQRKWLRKRGRRRKKLQRIRVGVNLKYPALPPAAALCPTSPLKDKHALLCLIWKGGPIKLVNKHHATAPANKLPGKLGETAINHHNSFLPLGQSHTHALGILGLSLVRPDAFFPCNHILSSSTATSSLLDLAKPLNREVLWNLPNQSLVVDGWSCASGRCCQLSPRI